MSPVARYRRRGSPLALIGLVLACWVSGRILLWESPFAMPVVHLAEAPPVLVTAAGQAPVHRPDAAQDAILVSAAFDKAAIAGVGSPRPAPRLGNAGAFLFLGTGLGTGLGSGLDPALALGHQLLWRAAMGDPLIGSAGMGSGSMRTGMGSVPVTAPFLPGRRAQAGWDAAGPDAGQNRWSLDAWAFWRAGSNAAPISQGRVPVYGASQLGGVLQYRLAPALPVDPRLYARAYRALVRRGESEVALGTSLRPLPRVPVRVAGEVRLTDGTFRTEARPAVFAVTELPPQRLPLKFQIDAYAQGGWVGGRDATAFVDAQGSLVREVEAIGTATARAVRFSLGAGAWGGAQRGAARIDVGPTLRLDLTLGEVPARLSVDWRERVNGNAGPESGVAATLSTQF